MKLSYYAGCIALSALCLVKMAYTESFPYEQKVQGLAASLAIPGQYSWNCLAIRCADLLSKSADQRYKNLSQALYAAALYTNADDVIESLKPHIATLTMLTNHPLDDALIAQAQQLITQLIAAQNTMCPFMLMDVPMVDRGIYVHSAVDRIAAAAILLIPGLALCFCNLKRFA